MENKTELNMVLEAINVASYEKRDCECVLVTMHDLIILKRKIEEMETESRAAKNELQRVEAQRDSAIAEALKTSKPKYTSLRKYA